MLDYEQLHSLFLEETQLAFTCSTLTRNTRTKVWNMFKVNNKDTKTMPRFGVFIVHFEHISHFCPSVSIVNFEHAIAGCEGGLINENNEWISELQVTAYRHLSKKSILI